jgi:hypothetical protein
LWIEVLLQFLNLTGGRLGRGAKLCQAGKGQLASFDAGSCKLTGEGLDGGRADADEGFRCSFGNAGIRIGECSSEFFRGWRGRWAELPQAGGGHEPDGRFSVVKALGQNRGSALAALDLSVANSRATATRLSARSSRLASSMAASRGTSGT